MKELNKQVRKWGLIIRCVSLSDIKILKQPETIPGVGGRALLNIVLHDDINCLNSLLNFIWNCASLKLNMIIIMDGNG